MDEIKLFLKIDHLDVWAAHIQYMFENKHFICGTYAVLSKDWCVQKSKGNCH